MFISHQFKAFDTNISMGVIDGKIDFSKIKEIIEEGSKKFEKKFSRFIGDSELNKINSSRKKNIKVSNEMINLLTKAKKAYLITDGIFDPTVLISLQSLGYKESFNISKNVTESPLPPSNNISKASIKTKFKKRATFNRLKILKNANTIVAPPNFIIDLGGIAKGYWVDKYSKILKSYFENFWLSAGGDTYTQGKKDNEKNWKIRIQHPTNFDTDILNLNLPSIGKGIATSGITKRHGVNGKINWHHIIDPRTGMPAKNSIISVTVIANSVTLADIMAKTVLILGIRKGLKKINSMQNYECVIIDKKLKIHFSKDIKKFL